MFSLHTLVSLAQESPVIVPAPHRTFTVNVRANSPLPPRGTAHVPIVEHLWLSLSFA